MDNSMEIRYVSDREPLYPIRLRQLSGMPEGLYVRGNLPADDAPAAAIVGARSCTHYGKNMAEEFARVLSGAGVQIISGLALGIDAAAHTGALLGGTPTFAVLANGAEECYPRSNRRVYDRILERGGGIISEHPAGTPPLPGYFPARNRIISALADVVLVVEARKKSGSLITVDWALEQGRPVYAIPGRVGDITSEGTNRLIAQGAGIACSPDTILMELGASRKNLEENSRQKKMLELSETARYLYHHLDSTPTSLEDLCRIAPYGLPDIMAALMELQIKGAVLEMSKNYYVKKTDF